MLNLRGLATSPFDRNHPGIRFEILRELRGLLFAGSKLIEIVVRSELSLRSRLQYSLSPSSRRPTVS